VDSADDVYVADNASIKKISPSGMVTTIVDSGLSYPSKIALDSFGNIFVTCQYENDIKIYTPNIPACDSTWHHVSLSYTPSTLSLSSYIDGVLVMQRILNVTLPSPSSSSLRIGWSYSGSISDLRIYNRTLSINEIVGLSQPVLPSYPNVVNPSPRAGGTLYVWYCPSGWFGSSQELTRSPSDGTWAKIGSASCQQCASNTFSYSGSSCSNCALDSSFVSSSLGCRPFYSFNTGPLETAFYLSGSQSESIKAFTVISNTSSGLGYYSNGVTFPNSAVFISNGSYVSSPILSSLPMGSSEFTVSSWVKCDASSLSDLNPSGVVIAWGESSPSTDLTAATLAVTSAERINDIPNVTSFAGRSSAGLAGGVGTNALFYNPCGVAVDSVGNVFVADFSNSCIRKITSSRIVTILAGSGPAGFADGTGSNAKFNYPQGVAVSSTGYVFVADTDNHRIRKITSSGVVTVLAGSGVAGFADGLGTNAKFYAPMGVVVDSVNNVYVADYHTQRIRKITPSGAVSTLAGSGSASFADGSGTLASFFWPSGVAVDSYDNIFVADSGNHRVRKVTSSGIVSTIAGSGTAGFADNTGTLAMFSTPFGIAVDSSGIMYVSDKSNHRIRKITPSGVVTVLAGSGVAGFADGLGTNAKFNYPIGISVDSSSNVFIADFNHQIRKINIPRLLPGPIPVCDSNWHHVTLSYSGSTSRNNLTAFVDGVGIGSTVTVYSITSSSSSSTLRLGWNGANEHFSGLISDVRVYSRALTNNEILLLKNSPPTPSATTSATASPSTYPSFSSSTSATSTPSSSLSASSSVSSTITASVTASFSVSISPTASPTTTQSNSISTTSSPSGSPSESKSASTTVSVTTSVTPFSTLSASSSASQSPKVSSSGSTSFSPLMTPSPSSLISSSASVTASSSMSGLTSPSSLMSVSASVTASSSMSGLTSPSSLMSVSASVTASSSMSGLISPSSLESSSATKSISSSLSALASMPTSSAVPSLSSSASKTSSSTATTSGTSSSTATASSTSTSTSRVADLQSSSPTPRPIVNLVIILENIQLSLFVDADRSSILSSLILAVSHAVRVSPASISFRRIRDVTFPLTPSLIWTNPQFAGDDFPVRRRLKGDLYGSVSIDVQISVSSTSAASILSSVITSSLSKVAHDILQFLQSQGSPLSGAQIKLTVEPFAGTMPGDTTASSSKSLLEIASPSFVGGALFSLIVFAVYHFMKSRSSLRVLPEKDDAQKATTSPETNNWSTSTRDEPIHAHVIESDSSQNNDSNTDASISEMDFTDIGKKEALNAQHEAILQERIAHREVMKARLARKKAEEYISAMRQDKQLQTSHNRLE
jgi:hypothetical protein